MKFKITQDSYGRCDLRIQRKFLGIKYWGYTGCYNYISNPYIHTFKELEDSLLAEFHRRNKIIEIN